MDEAVARIRALTGITEAQVSTQDLVVLLELNDGSVYCAAADAADQVAAGLMSSGAVTSVEDITIDHRRPVQAWQSLADRLRARCDQEQDNAAGPFVVEFQPRSGIEAVEHHA